MQPDLLDLYGRASAWAIEKIGGANQLDAPTPCDEWNVQALLNHMLETQRYFLAEGKGKEASPPSPNPPAIISPNPEQDFAGVRDAMLQTFADPAVINKTGPALGIAFTDVLVHGWDVAQATGQDATMPAGLADAAYEMLHGRLTDEQRRRIFKPEVAVAADAPPQARLLAFTGRHPA